MADGTVSSFFGRAETSCAVCVRSVRLTTVHLVSRMRSSLTPLSDSAKFPLPAAAIVNLSNLISLLPIKGVRSSADL